MRSTKHAVGRGAAYIYIETILSMILGYAFWILMSKIATTEVIGASSVLITFSGIMAVVANIGIPSGILRFLGKTFSEENSDESKNYITISVILVTISFIVCSLVLVAAKEQISQYFRANDELVIISIFLIASLVYASLFRGIIISSLNTRVLVPCVLVSGISKLALGIFLVLAGFGSVGLMLSFTLNQVLTSIILGLVTLSLVTWRSRLKISKDTFISTSKNILESSSVYWFPFLISTVGSQLGTVVVFGSEGSDQAGVYFMSLTIITGITSVMFSIFTIALPALSAMKNGRKRFAWNTIRLSAILVLPFTSALIFYAEEVLALLGPAYAEGSLSLQIMLLSILPTVVTYGINAFAYSDGNYRSVLLIGLASSLPRTVLYFILIPIAGAPGAGISYTVGAVIGCLISVIIAKQIKIAIGWRVLTAIFAVPLVVGTLFEFTMQNYILGILLTALICYLVFSAIGILRKSDVIDLLRIFPSPISSLLTAIFRTKGRYFAKLFFRR